MATDKILNSSNEPTRISSENSGGKIDVPVEFLTHSDITRDGQDLILTLENGDEIIIEGYFALETPPLVTSENGFVLTPDLVNSFSHSMEYAQMGSLTDASPVGAVKEVSGKATVMRTDGTTEQISQGTAIYEGDVIETEGDGAVNILFIDETEFAVSENARLAIDEYVFDPSTQEGTTNFSVLRGVFAFTSGLIGREDPDDVEIDTPVGSIGIRGTIIAGKIDPESGDSQITVVEGAIVVRNNSGEMTLSTQFETVRLQGFDIQIEPLGTLDSSSMNITFGAISGVSASLFSAINDTSRDTEGKPDTSGSPAHDASSADNPDDISAQNQNDSANTDQAQNSDATAQNTAPPPVSPSTKPTLISSLSGSDSSGLQPSSSSSLAAGQTTGQSSGSTVATSQGTSAGSGTVLTQSSTISTDTTANNVQQPSTIRPGNTTSGTQQSYILNDLQNNSNFGYTIYGSAGSGIGSSLAALGDINGDGRTEFVFLDTSGHYYKASLNGTALTTTIHNINASISNNLSNTVIAGGADMNADGHADFIIGAPNANGTINPTGQIALYDGDEFATTGQTAYGGSLSSGDNFGTSVAILGDFNSDGYADFAVSSPYDGSNIEGRIYVGLGGNAVLNTGFDLSTALTQIGDPFEQIASQISAAGDVNNDGYDDLIVSSNGRAHLVYGTQSAGITLDVIDSASGHTQFGHHVTGGGDFNSDGFSDLLISSVSTYGEQVNYFSYNSTNSDIVFSGSVYDSRTGWEIKGADFVGDYNGDGYDDIVIVSSNGTDNTILLLQGRPDAFSGNNIDLSNLPADYIGRSQKFFWNGVGDIEISAVGDIDNDGLDDFALGASAASAGSGQIKVLLGQEGATLIGSNIVAEHNGAALLGADGVINNLSDGGFSDVKLTGRGSNDTFVISGTPTTIDGNGGHDNLIYYRNGGSLDFRNVSRISGIEEINLNGNSQSLHISMNDLFELLETSRNGSLSIRSSVSGNDFYLLNDNDGTPNNPTSFGFTNNGTVNAGGDVMTHYSFGEYNLYIDQDVTVQV